MGNLVNKNINITTGNCSYENIDHNKFSVTIDLMNKIEVRHLGWSGYKSGKAQTQSRSMSSYDRRNLAEIQELKKKLEQIPVTVTGQAETLEYVKKQVQYALNLPENERVTFDQANYMFKFFQPKYVA